jgi:hypothetical protein
VDRRRRHTRVADGWLTARSLALPPAYGHDHGKERIVVFELTRR